MKCSGMGYSSFPGSGTPGKRLVYWKLLENS
jgi:hypothetical protein